MSSSPRDGFPLVVVGILRPSIGAGRRVGKTSGVVGRSEGDRATRQLARLPPQPAYPEFPRRTAVTVATTHTRMRFLGVELDLLVHDNPSCRVSRADIIRIVRIGHFTLALTPAV